MAIQKREYELSVWHEKLNSEGIKQEEKMAVIGAHDMTYLGRATAVKFTTKINGTHELSFQMPDKFFDSELGDFVLNEFNDYVANENKVKLFYKEQWFEFYVKNVKETKHYKSYMKNYTCTDAFIDELSRNGYGITFDTELYNNVEEIGTFNTEILKDSQWEYKPENNWGDFTEYLEEKLFRIPVGQFNELKGYKLEFDCPSNTPIVNRYTNEKRGLQLGDDQARVEQYFWDCQNSDKNIDLTKNKINIPNDGYIYVPYSQLSFCYKTTGEEETDGNFIVSTEEPIVETWKNIESILLVPTTIDPSALIEFIAIPEGAEIEVDEAGLIINKNYHYVMTVKDWNDNVNTKWWYTQDVHSDETKDYQKELIINTPNNTQFYRKPVVYDGYLTKINNLEIENGKKISISDRTEVNISEEIDQYVKVYNNKGSEYKDLYTNPKDWNTKQNYDFYRVCSVTKTRQIVPQLARNYFENAVNIQSTNGWEIMELKELEPSSNEISAKLELFWEEDRVEEGKENINDEIKNAYLRFIHSKEGTNTYRQNTIVNFGAIGQEKTIEKGRVYCFGIKTKQGIPIKPEGWNYGSYFIIGKGNINSKGDYYIDGYFNENSSTNIEETKVIKIDLYQGLKEQYFLIKSSINIENPYLGLYFNSDIDIEEVWFFEAYTKGIDQFTNGYYNYSGRDYVLDENQIGYASDGIKQLKKMVLFETDIMRGDTYGYQKYFIQQLALEDNSLDTFAQKEYLSENGSEGDSLPLSSQKYTEDDYKIITNYIDLNQCSYYKTNTSAYEYDCKFGGTDYNKMCMYQKYGYCPYLFKTEKHCRKIRTLNGSKSNRFNLTQELGKVFEVYPQYYIEHNSNGSIKKDGNRPIKDLFYITEKGQENKIGFRYEKNLADISRTIVSDQIVTKLYVEDNDSELSKTGMCSIKTAEDNPSKDNFIIDLSYYIKQGMLEQDQVYEDLYGTNSNNKGYLKQLGYNNTEYDKLSNKIINLTNESFTELEANIQTNLTGIDTVLKEIAKIRKQMSRYETKFSDDDTDEDKEQNDTYKNYLTKLKVQESRLASLIKDTLCSNNEYKENGEKIPINYPGDLVNPDKTGGHSNDYYIDDFKENHKIESGMLGQYNEQYKQIQKWKKQRAAYLEKINEISTEFFKLYEPYLKEGTWTDSNYLTDNAYYHDAVQVAAEGAIPKVIYDIKVVPLGIFDEDYEIGIADTTSVEDIGMFGINKKTGLPNRLKVIISQLDENLDKPNEDSISVQNFTTQFEDLFQQVTASVQSLTFNENIYKRSSNFTSNQNIETDSLQGTLDNNNLTLLNTQEQNIKLDATGQSGSDINNHNNKYKLDGQGLFFSNNGGESWNIGVGPGGINADYINTGTLDAGNIRIVDNDYIYFLWDKGGITAYRTPQSGTTFGKDFARFNKQGLSLVEENKIRLRAGYEYKDTYSPGQGEQDDPTKHGFIYNENQTITDQNMGFYLYNEEGNAIFKTETGDKSARLSLAGEIYADSRLDKTIDDTGDIGIYIYNQNKNGPRVMPQDSSKRLFSILQVPDRSQSQYEENDFINILSVLKNGTLYIGSTAKAFKKNEDDQGGELIYTTTLNEVGDFLEIDKTNPQCISFRDGKIWFGEQNLIDAINQKIADIEADVRAHSVGQHRHKISPLSLQGIASDDEVEVWRTNISPLNSAIREGSWNYSDGVYTINEVGTIEYSKIQNKNIFSNYDDIYIGISNQLISETGRDTQNWILDSFNIDWIKLTDFIKILKTAEDSYTDNYGIPSGGGDYYNPDYYDNTNVVNIGKEVIEAHYDVKMSQYPNSRYYYWDSPSGVRGSYYFLQKTVSTNYRINSRADCSGYINGIWQALGDVTAEASQWWTTASYANNNTKPANWVRISMRDLGNDWSKLQPGDVIYRANAISWSGYNPGTGTGHTEFITEVNGANNIKIYGLGGDSQLIASHNNDAYLSSNWYNMYDAILRREKTDIDDDIINYDEGAYNATRGFENTQAVDAYFHKKIKKDFIGCDCPTDISEFRDVTGHPEYKGLRCLVDACSHEYEAWPFAAQGFVKLVRMAFIGNSGWQVQNYSDLYGWIYYLSITYGNNRMGTWEMNNGTNTAPTASLEYVQAIYNNFRNPYIYGSKMHYPNSKNFKNIIVRSINEIPGYNVYSYDWMMNGKSYNCYDVINDTNMGKTPLPEPIELGRYFLLGRYGNEINMYNENIVE